MKSFIFIALLFVLTGQSIRAAESSDLLKRGWEELVRDNDTSAMRHFEAAHEAAVAEGDRENSATALLDMGICAYGTSYSQGLHYCMRAMDEFALLEGMAPEAALRGRSKCLQLISTIHGRQGKYRDAIRYSREAMRGFPLTHDTSGYLGLIYHSLGSAYERLGRLDSAEHYHRLALEERLRTGNVVYLPGSYLSVAGLELERGNLAQSHAYYLRSLAIADSTGNRQAEVLAELGLGRWHSVANKDARSAEECYLRAKGIAAGLSDKSFYLKALEALLELKKQAGEYEAALGIGEEVTALKDTLASWERGRITRSLEVQFEVAEKDRRLAGLQSERDIASLTNAILGMGIGFVVLVAAGTILFLRKSHRRDMVLLRTQEELARITNDQQRLREQQMRNELEFKESQLSAMALQMLQKNELLLELKARLDQESALSKDAALNRIMSKGLNQDKEWADFNAYFEGINKNFYVRLKQAFPDISPNDLKICALIKLNLSIKEMAGILNISADSVKTARYRLRKKLQLSTEDNLTDFILNLQ